MYRKRLLALLISLGVASQLHASNHGHGLNVSINDDEDVTSCDQIHIRAEGREIARSEDRLTFPSMSSTVHVESSKNGGIYVYGWDRQDFGVLNCKAALSDDLNSAQRRLLEIKASFEGGRLAVQGPSDGDWVSYLIVHAPRSSSLALSGINGPISVSDVAGKLEVHAQNGPFSIKHSGGEINAEVVNGPISYSGQSGDVRLHAQNGPVSVSLDGNSWNGKGLEAGSTNGPLSLDLPRNYNSGVVVKTRGYSPFSCSRCDGARKDFDDSSKSVQFGSGDPVVRMSTVNGPVSVNERD